MTKFKRAAPVANESQPKPKRTRAAAPRPTHLIMVVNRKTTELKVIFAHGQPEAEAAFENLSSTFAESGNDTYLVPVPEASGFAAVQMRSVHSAESPVWGRDAIQAPASTPASAPAPTKFRRQTADEFQQETIAMMNGEIPIGGIPMRDADDPISDGGAMGL